MIHKLRKECSLSLSLSLLTKESKMETTPGPEERERGLPHLARTRNAAGIRR